MKSAGIDIGSRTVKVVVIDAGGRGPILSRKAFNSHDPIEKVRELLDGVPYDSIAATGYGRHLVKDLLNCPVLSEIKAFGLGARSVFPDCRTILDIGGQDTKAISLTAAGEIQKFEMNDKCAAGTGRFLEVMANALSYSLDEFSQAALAAGKAEKINSMCTVFAESEVISLTARGAARNEVALAIHKAIVSRSVALLRKVSPGDGILFAGGVAFNRCVSRLVEEELARPVFVPEDPQIIGALGAAIYAARPADRGNIQSPAAQTENTDRIGGTPR